ncbi:hypothetical protein VP01_424g4 [Puccinia sorghi]|uniref:Uncharacterized protein n=1 Tax=Puccinia sorghi TaxID=27349 RepID=A0A0L6UR99_9BASI|nr:hypothetical protein VP01_424g4 [Puccinia sorghi]
MTCSGGLNQQQIYPKYFGHIPVAHATLSFLNNCKQPPPIICNGTSWLFISTNPIQANSMKHDNFWNKEAENLNEHSECAGNRLNHRLVTLL